jgi:hypothetical protein
MDQVISGWKKIFYSKKIWQTTRFNPNVERMKGYKCDWQVVEDRRM